MGSQPFAPLELARSERTIDHLLRRQAARHPDAPWILSGDERHTFAAADALVDRHAGALASLGVRAGTPVAVLMANRPEFVWITLAIGRLGAVFVPVNTAYEGRFLGHVLGHAGVEVVVCDPDFVDRVSAVAADLGQLKACCVVGPAAPPGRVPAVALDDIVPGTWNGRPPVIRPADPMAVLYTSGTTGASKGAVISHNYWYDATLFLADKRDIRPDDVFYVCSPMFHAAAWLCQIFSALLFGLPVGIDAGFSVRNFWDRLRHYGATQIFTMSAMHMWLWNAPPRPDDADNPARVWGPVPLPADLHEPFRRRFGVEHLWFTYGQTEAMVITATRAGQPYKPGSSGWTRPEVELAVVDDDDHRLAPDTIGELVVRPLAPHTIMDGYWNAPDLTVRAFRNLWYHTGDLARIDRDGEVFFVDRKADYLRVHGENISSFEVEATIGDHPGVDEVAAIGLPADERTPGLDDELIVWVVPADGETLDPGDLAAYCAAQLPRFAVPRYIALTDELPRTPTGRVQKYVLRQRGVVPGTWDRATGTETAKEQP